MNWPAELGSFFTSTIFVLPHLPCKCVSSCKPMLLCQESEMSCLVVACGEKTRL